MSVPVGATVLFETTGIEGAQDKHTSLLFQMVQIFRFQLVHIYR